MKDSEIRANFERFQANFDRMEALIEHLATVIRAGFERTDLRFERVEARFSQVDARLDHLDARIGHLGDTTAEHFEVLETPLRPYAPAWMDLVGRRRDLISYPSASHSHRFPRFGEAMLRV